MTVASRSQAVKKALASTRNIPGYCQGWVREIIYGAPSAGDQDNDGDADAVDGWKSEPLKYRYADRKPPKGYSVAWSGGSNGNGHRAVSLGPDADGDYMLRSTDAGGKGIVATVPLSWVEKVWGLTYLGWSKTISGNLIPDDIPDEPTPGKKPRKRRRKHLTILMWNIKTGNAAAPETLGRLLDRHQPDIAAVFEAYSFHPRDPFHDYTVYQESTPHGWSKEPVSERGETAVLVSPNAKARFSRVKAMTKNWFGPKGNKHEPRRYRRGRIRVDGQSWRFSFEHWATRTQQNKPAYREGVRSAHAWLRGSNSLPTFFGGDLNAFRALLKGWFPNASVGGDKVDNVVAKGAVVTSVQVLGKFGSDHEAILVTLTKIK